MIRLSKYFRQIPLVPHAYFLVEFFFQPTAPILEIHHKMCVTNSNSQQEIDTQTWMWKNCSPKLILAFRIGLITW